MLGPRNVLCVISFFSIRAYSGTLRDNAAALDSFVSSKARFEPLGVTDAGVEDDAVVVALLVLGVEVGVKGAEDLAVEFDCAVSRRFREDMNENNLGEKFKEYNLQTNVRCS